MAQGALLRHYKANKNNSKWERTIGCVLPCHGENCALLGRNGNTLKLKMTAKLKDIQTSITTHHGRRPIANVCHLPGPPSFSLQTTFKL
jgi:hypothetical protein